MYKSHILCIGALLFLSSCGRTNIDPSPSFVQIKNTIAQRTGRAIQWNNKADDDNNSKIFVDKALKQNLTVDAVIQITLLNNKRLQAIYESLGVAQAEVVQAGLFKNPTLAYSLRYDKKFGSDKIIEIDILQNFLDILLMPLKKRMARTELEILKNLITGDVMEIIAQSKIAFYTLQAAEKTLLLRKQVQETTEAAFDAAKRLRTAGTITHLELVVERSFYEQSKIGVSQAEMDVVEAREKLNVLMGLWGLQTDWTITPQLEEIPKELSDFKEIENHVVANSLDIRMARKHIFATATKVGIDTARIVFPELGIGINSEREPSGNWFVGPQFILGIPLFDFGQARSAAGKAELNQLCNEYYALAVELRSATDRLALDYGIPISKIAILKRYYFP